MPREIVVTGMGALSGNGLSVSHIWENLIHGEAALMDINPRYHFDIARFEKSCRTRKEGSIHSVCGVKLTNEELASRFGVAKASLYDRHQLFAFAAGAQAIADARLTLHTISERFGCVAATASGGLGDLFDASEELVQGKRPSPTAITRFLPGMLSGDLTRTYRLRGPNPTHTGVCAASAHALINAADIIKCSRADVMLVVGSEASINPAGIASFCSTGVISNKTQPYQNERMGFHKGEGGAALILEEYEHARKRGATIYARIAGYGETNDGDASSSITSPRIDGGMRSAQLAITMAGVTARDIGYVNTHGTGTELGDIAELTGINGWAEAGYAPLVSSTKSYSGHLFGAAGAYEAILTIMMLRNQTFLPTHGLTHGNLDPKCDLPGIQHLYSIESRKIDHAVSNSFGFGGTNATIVFEKV